MNIIKFGIGGKLIRIRDLYYQKLLKKPRIYYLKNNDWDIRLKAYRKKNILNIDILDYLYNLKLWFFGVR